MSGPNVTALAWRNLWRNRRRTLLTMGSIVFGVFLAVVFTAMQDRNWKDMIDLAARLGGGHVSLQHPEYLDKPTLTRTVVRGEEIQAALGSQRRRVAHAVDRVIGPTMLATAGENFSAAFIAFDPGVEDETTLSILEALDEGAALESGDTGGVVLGHRLASNLGMELGDKVVYTLTDKNGEIVSGLARLRGTLKTNAPTVDGGFCLLPLDTVRGLLGYGEDEATMVAVFLHDQRQSARVAAELGRELDGRAAAVPWNTSQPQLAAFIALKVGGAVVMEILIAFLVAAGIFNTLFVSVMERLREFGIMLAIGWSPGRLFRLVMMESVWLAALGLVGAFLITAGPYLYLSSTGLDLTAVYGGTVEIAGVGLDPVLKVGIFPRNAVMIALFAVGATLASGIYPAWRAGRVEPVETIKVV